MEPIGHDIDDVDALRSRLTEHDRLWAAAQERLAAFARLEELAEAQATTPEALAARAGLARTEARSAELHAECEALEATARHVGTEVDRLEQARSQAEHHLDQVTADLERRTADLEAIEREVTSLLITRAERAAEVDELTAHRDELCAEVAELLDGLEELRTDDLLVERRTASPADLLAGATPPEYEEADSAFAEFFESDIEHDKSREWMLSDGEQVQP